MTQEDTGQCIELVKSALIRSVDDLNKKLMELVAHTEAATAASESFDQIREIVTNIRMAGMFVRYDEWDSGHQVTAISKDHKILVFSGWTKTELEAYQECSAKLQTKLLELAAQK